MVVATRAAGEAAGYGGSTVGARGGAGDGAADGDTYDETTGGGVINIYIYKHVYTYIVYTYYNRPCM